MMGSVRPTLARSVHSVRVSSFKPRAAAVSRTIGASFINEPDAPDEEEEEKEAECGDVEAEEELGGIPEEAAAEDGEEPSPGGFSTLELDMPREKNKLLRKLIRGFAI